jgi:hypothetical protein
MFEPGRFELMLKEATPNHPTVLSRAAQRFVLLVNTHLASGTTPKLPHLVVSRQR